MPGPRGMVMSDAAELDRWQQGATKGPAGSRRTWFATRRILLAAGAILALSAAVAVFWPAGPQAHAFEVEGNRVTVFDGNGAVMWSRAFRQGQDFWKSALERGVRPAWVGDLDGDGAGEVLIFHKRPGSVSGMLTCFSDTGDPVWTFSPGRPVRTATEEFGTLYQILTFAVEKANPARIAVSAAHHRFYPNQVSLLSHEGEVTGEYWHSGWLFSLLFSDLNHDGKTELYAGGVSNSARQATLVALDPDQMTGASAEPASHQLLDLGKPSEIRRMTFAPGCLNLELDYNYLRTIERDGAGLTVESREIITATEQVSVYYRLDAGLEVERIEPADAYLVAHRRLFREGLLDHEETGEEHLPPQVLEADPKERE